MEYMDHIVNVLGDNGLRRTRGRVMVLEVLMSSDEPLTHQEIYDQVASTGVHRVSIYRVLHSLMEAGIVHRIEAGDRLWRFAVCGCGRSSHCHPHFTCKACGKVECLTQMELPYYDTLQPGYVVEEQEVYIHGLCAACSHRDQGIHG